MCTCVFVCAKGMCIMFMTILVLAGGRAINQETFMMAPRRSRSTKRFYE